MNGKYVERSSILGRYRQSSLYQKFVTDIFLYMEGIASQPFRKKKYGKPQSSLQRCTLYSCFTVYYYVALVFKNIVNVLKKLRKYIFVKLVLQ